MRQAGLENVMGGVRERGDACFCADGRGGKTGKDSFKMRCLIVTFT